MSGLGGLNKSPKGVVIGLVQLQLPTVVTPADLGTQVEKIVAMVTKAKKGMPSLDLVVFPEYALHGLSMDTNPAIMCRIDGPEVAAFKAACARERVWGCFSLMEQNPHGNPYNSGIIIDAAGELRLYYRKMHPWTPVEPWEPGDLGIPVCDGPNGSKLALIICHDAGDVPRRWLRRGAAYKGADIMLRTAGYTGPIRHAWRTTNQANAFCNLMVTASVCMCGTDGVFNSMGEGMIVQFDGTPIVMGSGVPDEIVTAEVRPDLVAEARTKVWRRREQHLPAGAPRLRRGQRPRRARLPVHVHARSGRGQIPPSLGEGGAGHGRNELRVPRADATLRRVPAGSRTLNRASGASLSGDEGGGGWARRWIRAPQRRGAARRSRCSTVRPRAATPPRP